MADSDDNNVPSTAPGQPGAGNTKPPMTTEEAQWVREVNETRRKTGRTDLNRNEEQQLIKAEKALRVGDEDIAKLQMLRDKALKAVEKFKADADKQMEGEPPLPTMQEIINSPKAPPSTNPERKVTSPTIEEIDRILGTPKANPKHPSGLPEPKKPQGSEPSTPERR